MGTRKMLRTRRQGSHSHEGEGRSDWDRKCVRCRRQCNNRGLSRDGLSECPAGGRHHLA